VSSVLRGRGPHKAGYVFEKDGAPLYQTWVNQRHSKLRKLLKLPTEFVPHTFRHTYGTRLGEAGTDAFTIMKLMGNSSETVSQRYVHPTPETLERAVDRLQKLNSENRAAEDLKEKVPQESPPVKSRRAVKLQ
jgi:integrase